MENRATDFYDIYGYYSTPFLKTTAGKVTLIILGLLTLGLIIFFWWRYTRSKKLQSWEWAHLELNKLNIAACNHQADFKRLYFSISTILKTYLHKRYDWQTLDKTDDELIPFLAQKKFDATLLESFKKMGGNAQWIKFANEGVLKTQAEADVAFAHDLIEKTKPTLEEQRKQAHDNKK